MIDITLCCGGRQIKAHRLLLSACSPYFREILQDNPCQHPVVFVAGCNFTSLRQLIDFIYCGQVHVQQAELEQLLKLARQLHVQPLMDADSPDSDWDESQLSPSHERVQPFSSQRQQQQQQQQKWRETLVTDNERRSQQRTPDADHAVSRSSGHTPKRRRASVSPLPTLLAHTTPPSTSGTGTAHGTESPTTVGCMDTDSHVVSAGDVTAAAAVTDGAGSNPRSVTFNACSDSAVQSRVKQECSDDERISDSQQPEDCHSVAYAGGRDDWNSFNHHIACKSEHWMLSDPALDGDSSAIAAAEVYDPSHCLSTTPSYNTAPHWLTAALGSGSTTGAGSGGSIASTVPPAGLLSASISPTTSSTSSSSYSCQDCGRMFRSEASMNNHRSMHRGSTRCPHCGMVYSTISAMRRHVRMAHELSGAVLNAGISGGNLGGTGDDLSSHEPRAEDAEEPQSVELVD